MCGCKVVFLDLQNLECSLKMELKLLVKQFVQIYGSMWILTCYQPLAQHVIPFPRQEKNK